MPVTDVDLILFEAGGRKWAADPWDVVRVDHNVVFPTLQIGNHRGSSPGERIHTAPFVRARKHASFTTAGCRFTPRPLTGE